MKHKKRTPQTAAHFNQCYNTSII